MSKNKNSNDKKKDAGEGDPTLLEEMRMARREIESWPDWKVRSMEAFFSRREKSSRYRKEKGEEPIFSG